MGRAQRSQKTKYFLIAVTKWLFNQGVGKSKHEMFQQSYEKDETRQTPYIHTYPTAARYEKIVANFGDFLTKEYGLKYLRDFINLTYDELYVCVDRYFEKEKEKQKSESTLKIHISALSKVLGTISPDFVKEYFTPINRSRWRDGVVKGDNDRYNNPDKVVENLKSINETAYIVSELQRLTGARVGDVKKIMIDEQNTRVFIQKSKGGRNRFVYYDRFRDDFERVKELKEKLDKVLEERRFSEIREQEYYNSLRKACRQAHEPYRGSHSFRYEWAQERYKVISQWNQEEQEQYYRRILEDRNLSKEDIEGKMKEVKEKNVIDVAIISEELGHSRIDISVHYLKIRRK